MFSSEFDKRAQETYQANHGELPFGDITKIEPSEIPKHDILCAGFPCQAFSIAGKRKGFEDSRGQLFFNIAKILKEKRPKAFILENVPGLLSHDQGQTLQVILQILRDELGYRVPIPEVLNAKDFGLAQRRARVFIVGFRPDLDISLFQYPAPLDDKHRVCIDDILEGREVSPRYYLSTHYWSYLQRRQEHHKRLGNKFGYNILSPDSLSYTLTRKSSEKQNLIIDKRLTNFTPETNIKGEINREGIRRLTPRECARLQGFPESFKIVVADTNAYAQFGNSIAIPVVEAIVQNMLDCLAKRKVMRSSPIQTSLSWFSIDIN